MNPMPSEVNLRLPEWLIQRTPALPSHIESLEDRMELMLELCRENIERETGGPFAAAVFERDSGTLISIGINIVISSGISIAHAEMVALALAQKRLSLHTLSEQGLPPTQLVTSTEPCAMCLGAIPWSGIRSLVCGARDEDARDVGFDEGDKPADWPFLLNQRGIEVHRDLHRERARELLKLYIERGGIVYNGRP